MEGARSPVWDPAIYERFQRERDRPAQDLIARLPGDLQPRAVYDLGCGTGHHAAQFARAWPEATVEGIDSSADMLAAAESQPGRPPHLRFRQGTIEVWGPSVAAGLVFSNAALQWCEAPEAQLTRLFGLLAPGGVLAVQVPLTADSLWHRALREVAAAGPWAGLLVPVKGVQAIAAPAIWYDVLAAARPASIDIWQTIYLHVLEGEHPVADWMAGTALRPFLDALRLAGRPHEDFLAAVRAKLAALFPRAADGRVLLPFPRQFLVARRA